MEITAMLRITNAQHGCATKSQLLDVMTARQFEYLIDRRTIERIHPRTYVVTGTSRTWETRAMAALLSIPGSALSHRAAARFHGMTFATSEYIELTVPYEQRGNRTSVTVHRSRQLRPFVQDGAMPVTSVARTIVDLSSSMYAKQLGALFDQACNAKKVTLAELQHCVAHMTHTGRGCLSNIDNVIAARNTVDESLDSFLERRTLQWLREAGFPEPEAQVSMIRNGSEYRPDLVYAAAKVALEPAGPHHLLPSVAAYDRKRDIDFNLDGWIVFHIYPEMEPNDLLPRLTQALRQRTLKS